MKSKLTTQQKWIILLLAFVLVNAVVWMYGLAPAMQKVDAAREERDQTYQHRDSLQQQLDTLSSIPVEDLNTLLATLSPRVPEQGLLREFISDFVDLTDDMGLPLTDIAIGSPAEAEPFTAVTLSTTVQGDYAQLKSFLVALEEHERLITVQTFTLSGGEELLTSSVNFTIYSDDFGQLTPLDADGRDNPFVEK